MTIVITMAGLGSRFRKAGYTVPKYEIVVHGKTLFTWSMLSLSGYECSNYVFIVRKEDNAEAFILSECEKLNISGKIVEIDYMTSGQAETALLAKPYWDSDGELLVYNIDTYVEEFEMNRGQLHGDGFVPCFVGEGDHWSFVSLNDQGEAVEVREKQRISKYCTVGAYYFRTARLYEELYQEYYSGAEHLEKGERYIAPLYNHLIQKGGKVFISNIPAQKVHVLGTPEEVQQFEKEIISI